MQLFTRPQLCNDGGAGWLIFPYVWLELELNGIDAVPFDRFFWDAWLGIGYDGLPGFFFVRHAGFMLDATNLLLNSTWIIVAMLGIDVLFGRYHRKRRGQHRRYFS